MDYIQINLDISPHQPWTEILTQELADIAFDSFAEENKQLQAYIAKDQFNEQKFNALIEEYRAKDIQVQFEKKIIPSQNWNATWEADYEPVKIGKQLLIHAPFHQENKKDFDLTIEIQPQMSFGTGHHQTTYLLSKHLLDVDFKNKNVLDVGTGTGVLGILAAQLGAKSIFGTDIEDGVVENAIENCERNKIDNFKVVNGDVDVIPNSGYDVIIANINKNVLKQHLKNYAQLINNSGLLFLSGFFETDIPELSQYAKQHHFDVVDSFTKETWAVVKLIKTN